MAIFLSVMLFADKTQVAETSFLLQNVKALAQDEYDDSNKGWLSTTDDYEYVKMSCGHTITRYYCYIKCISGGSSACKEMVLITVMDNCSCQWVR